MTLSERGGLYNGALHGQRDDVDTKSIDDAARAAAKVFPDTSLDELDPDLGVDDLLQMVSGDERSLPKNVQKFVTDGIRFRAAGILANGNFNEGLLDADIERIVANQKLVVASPEDLRGYLEHIEAGGEPGDHKLGREGFHFGAHSAELLNLVHKYGYIFVAEYLDTQTKQRHLLGSIYGLHEMPLDGGSVKYGGNNRPVKLDGIPVNFRNLDVENLGDRNDRIDSMRERQRREILCQWRTTVRPDSALPEVLKNEFEIESLRRLGIALMLKYTAAQYGLALNKVFKDDDQFPEKKEMLLHVGEIDYRGDYSKKGAAINFPSAQKNRLFLDRQSDYVRRYFQEVDDPKKCTEEKLIVLQLRVFRGSLERIVAVLGAKDGKLVQKGHDINKAKKAAKQRAKFVHDELGYQAIW